MSTRSVSSLEYYLSIINSKDINFSFYRNIWTKNRDISSSEDLVKYRDEYLATARYLIPVSLSQTQEQWLLFLKEAEFPGISSQFIKLLVGGLVLKKPVLKFLDISDENISNELSNWLLNSVTINDDSLAALITECLKEMILTEYPWLYVNRQNDKVYPDIIYAEAISNVILDDNDFVKTIVVNKGKLSENIWSGTDTYYIHEIANNGLYQVITIKGNEIIDVQDQIYVNNERLTYIPIWPLSKSYTPNIPMISAIINKEVALYNKVSRRNHALYAASTFTPWIASDMDETDFMAIVNRGLGSWMKLAPGDDCGSLSAPTDSLSFLNDAVQENISEIAQLGVRMLTKEMGQSGIALELRDASQKSILGSLANALNDVFKPVFVMMINWKYGMKLDESSIDFSLNKDFMSERLDANMLKLVGDWYERKLIPRSMFLDVLKQNQLASPDYEDSKGIEEINDDELLKDNEPPSQMLF